MEAMLKLVQHCIKILLCESLHSISGSHCQMLPICLHYYQQWKTLPNNADTCLPPPLSAALEAALKTALLMLPPVMSNLASISKSTSSASGTSSGINDQLKEMTQQY